MKEKTLSEINKHFLFRYVHCNSYYQRAFDGKFLEKIGEDYYYRDSNNINFCERAYDSDYVCRKEYYKHKKYNFSGVVVGFKRILIHAKLYEDSNCADYGGCKNYVQKQPTEYADCAIVYYASGRKRYVPIQSITLKV